MSGYYPESYLRKRQREQGVRRVIIGVAVLVILAVVGIPISIFAVQHFAALKAGTDAPALAREKQELEQQSKIENLPDQQWAVQAGLGAAGKDTAAPQLDELDYAASFPQLSVGLEAVSAPADAAGTEQPGQETAGISDPALLPPAEVAATGSGVDPDPVTDLSGARDAAGAAVADSSSMADKYQRVDPQQAADKTAADRTAADKATADKVAKDKAAKDKAAKDKAAKDKAAKDKAAKDKAAKEKAREEERKRAEAEAKKKDKTEDKDSQDKPAKPRAGEASILLVYGGSFHTEEDAKKAKSSLSNIGLSGTVISDEVGHRLLIMQTEDLASANALIKKLHDSGFGSAYMTRKRK
ncbi:SPOR domain-containing protein [bacterium]|nr:SPOR domain-containing protein [bacterium]